MVQSGTVDSTESMIIREDSTLNYAKLNEMLNMLSDYSHFFKRVWCWCWGIIKNYWEKKKAVQQKDDGKIKKLLCNIGGFAEEVTTGVLSASIKDQIKGII